MWAFNRVLLSCFVMLSAGAVGAGCGEDEPTTFCCALERLCNTCLCDSVPEYRTIAQSKEEDTCRFALEDDQLGCTTKSETDALADCATPPE